MIVHKCEKCGKDIDYPGLKSVKEIECKHCHSKYQLTKATKYKALAIVIVMILVFAFLMALVSEIIDQRIAMIVLGILLGIKGNDIALWILSKVGQLKYTKINEA